MILWLVLWILAHLFALGSAYNRAQICLYNVDSNLNYYGLSVDTDKLVYNVNSTKTHSFQHGTVEIAKINSNGLYIGSNLLSSPVLGYLNTVTSNVQTQLNGKQNSGSYMLTSGSTITGNIVWSNQYGLNWQLGGQLSCDLNGDMHFNLYGKKYFFQQTGFSKVTITSTGIGIGTETPTYPLHIITYASSTQTYKYLNYSGLVVLEHIHKITVFIVLMQY